VRADGDVAAALAGVTAEMRALDPDLVFITTETMRQTIAVKLLPVRLGAALLLVFGVMALVLAAAGLYGVIAYSVSRRTREIGLRMALGARRAGVLGLVMRQGLGLAAVGIGVGLAGAAAAGGVLSSLLYGIGAIDPPAFAVAAGLLVAVAALATWVPARRAARVDPIVALRDE
jgi:putative ABC transport system permease protein